MTAGLAASPPASAFDPYVSVPADRVINASPAYRYANMTDQQAVRELRARHISFRFAESVPFVRVPVRLTGPLHGVYIHSSVGTQARATTPYEICDARMLLALDDFAALLAKHDIDEVVHYTMYRPPAGHRSLWPSKTPKESLDQGASLVLRASEQGAKTGPQSKPPLTTPEPSKPIAGKGKPAGKPVNVPPSNKPPQGEAAGKAGKPAAKPQAQPSVTGHKPQGTAHKSAQTSGQKPSVATPSEGSIPPRTWTGPGNSTPSRHPQGLAIDAALFHKRGGGWLSVAGHFQGEIGAQTCGAGARPPEDETAKELWAIACEAYEHKVFTTVLTPNFNEAHQDHFHMELKPAARWFLIH